MLFSLISSPLIVVLCPSRSGSPTRPSWVDAGSLQSVHPTRSRENKRQQMLLCVF